MSDFSFYFRIGWQHIIGRDALDHQLFILALAAIYMIKDWKQVLILVTAFTIGHSVTLFLSVKEIITISSKWVEFLIPCTIIFTAITNLFLKKFTPKTIRINYFLALFFGLIHGLGFANTIRLALASEKARPVLTSVDAATTSLARMWFSVPSSSSAPQRPQFE